MLRRFPLTRLALLLAVSSPALLAQSLPNRPVPTGMRSLSAGGSGRVLTTTLSGSSSATKMTQALLRGVQPYFDGTARVLHAIGDRNDRQVQASFTARQGGVPVLGLIGVNMEGSSARAVLIFDAQRALPGSIDRLVRVATSATSGGGAAVTPVALSRTPIPDGSGNIDLASGWAIRHANKGAMDIQAPYPGSGMSLGAVFTLPYASMDPTQALVTYSNGLARSQGKTIQVNIIDSRPMQWQQGGRAALVRYRVVMEGQTMEYFGLFAVTPFQEGQVFWYSSFIQAPPQHFAQVLSTGMRSWASWSISPAVLAQRMQQAAQTMRETGELMTGGGGGSSRAFDGVNAGWGQYIRGVATLEDPSRVRSEVDQSLADNLVRADPQHYRILPTSELVP